MSLSRFEDVLLASAEETPTLERRARARAALLGGGGHAAPPGRAAIGTGFTKTLAVAAVAAGVAAAALRPRVEPLGAFGAGPPEIPAGAPASPIVAASDPQGATAPGEAAPWLRTEPVRGRSMPPTALAGDAARESVAAGRQPPASEPIDGMFRLAAPADRASPAIATSMRLRVSTGIGAAASGYAGGALLGPSAFVEVGASPLGWRSSARLGVRRTEGDVARLAVRLTAARLDLCPVEIERGPMALGGCAVAEVGALDVRAAQRGVRPWIAPGGIARARVALARTGPVRWSLEVEGGAIAPLVRDRMLFVDQFAARAAPVTWVASTNVNVTFL